MPADDPPMLLSPNDPMYAIAALFDRVAEGYDAPELRCFPAGARWLVALADLHPGQRVLDVATGTGAALLPAAATVGPTGQVVGIDIAPGMLAQARQRLTEAGVTQVKVQGADARHLPFPDATFDAVLCSLGIFFLPDMAAALTEWQRVTRPGGTIAFTGFGLAAFYPLVDRLVMRLQQMGVTVPDVLAAQLLPLPEEYLALVEHAGLVAATMTRKQFGYFLPNGDAWWQVVWHSGFRGLFTGLPPDQIAQIHDAHLRDILDLRTSVGLWLDVPLVGVVGRRP
ncbi:MAG: methyltransferase domain-containing protein [Ktedonobacterales bacterium]|nr:methyltransferase domain-containing protein [Ktedonobacterales bacterium]